MGNFNLEATLKKVRDEFAGRSPQEMVWKTGTAFDDGQFTLTFLNFQVRISHPEGEVVEAVSGQPVGLIERILILHYMVHAGGSPLAKKDISFKELPGGSIYIDPFTNRCIRPLVALFGQDLPGFQMAAEKCGGTRQTYGHASYQFNALPCVPVTLVIWEGDEEFPASANILFDQTAGDYLPTEDFAFLCGLLVGMLKKAKGSCGCGCSGQAG